MATYRLKRGGLHERFHNCRKKVQVVGGGFGNGKSAAVVVRAISLCRDYPGCNGLIAMATYAQLNDTIREEFYKWVPPSSVKRWPTISDNTLIFKNGSKVNFRYIQQKGKGAAADGQTSSNLLSATYDFAVVDQIENPAITYKDYLDLLGRLRGSTEYRGTDETMPKSGPRWLMLTANPSFNWFFHKIIKPWTLYKNTGEISPDLPVDEETGEVLIEVFEGSTRENEHNLPADFIRGMEAVYKGQFRDRYIEGQWGALEGLVYPDFKLGFHVIHKERIMRYLYDLGYKGLKPVAFEGFDYGIASPSCYLLGFADYRGRVFVVDGFYKAGMNIQEIGERICRIQSEYFPYMDLDSAILADPAIFKRTITLGIGQGADTIKSILINNFPLSFRPAQNEILGGIAKVASYLAVDSFPVFDDPTKNGPLIYFASHLTFIFDEFQSYFWKMDRGFERTDEPIDKNDHAMDTLKYCFSYLPPATKLMFNYSAIEGRDRSWMKRA